MHDLGFGLTVNQVEMIAFEVAVAYGRRHFFNTENNCASKKVPENLSAYRVSMANHTMVYDYFEKLTDTIAKLNIQDKPEYHVRNVNETGIMYVVKPGKVKKLWRTWGNYYTFGLHMCQWDLDNTFHNIQRFSALTFICQRKAGYQRNFLKFGLNFSLRALLVRQDPYSCFMDSRGSHITPEVIELARSNYVHMLTFPSHTTHILQPLDVGVYESLKCA
ncbi:hypothetical protein PR048_025060 [Dryococelus australis]|uniref:DDE-1 domain-containing protein n=1 Tax=Dryococelus australis TaxID=614101 RepID=A0ABQ9GQC0_9NEOP|nr:hypothetical protein PR048_025060 [Dryococelus australis]